MISERKYNLINNVAGWTVFIVALLTYWFTLEPTASYWDCGEYVAQAAMLEVGHPPGNPVFMLAGRVFCNFASSPSQYALMVNAMSGLLSALTILFLFWTITALAIRALNVQGDIKPQKAIIAIGSGVVGALAYTWSDTFWFSAVEAEVYAFSSFCTAIVVWLALKWERRSDSPHSDRYLILIAYIIGLSIAVHLLNLLCIPAIALIVAYRRHSHRIHWLKLTGVLLLSFVIVALVLFGLVPGFVKMAQYAELLCVNTLKMPFNSGVSGYVVLFTALSIWTLFEINRQSSSGRIRLSVFLTIVASGMLTMGDGVIPLLLTVVAGLLIFVAVKRINVRLCNLIVWSIFSIFMGYSSYALILIRANANPPMNQNAVDNVFALASYLGREQYKEHPLIYGPTPFSEKIKTEHTFIDTVADDTTYSYTGFYKHRKHPRYVMNRYGVLPELSSGFASKEDSAANARRLQESADCYLFNDYAYDYVTTPELNMLLPRIFSPAHMDAYQGWTGMTPANMDSVEVSDAVTAEGDFLPFVDNQTGQRIPRRLPKPTVAQNLSYLFGYQIGYMYMRYFMWNFCGRQNDLQSQGQTDAGNFITGIDLVDDAMLGRQSLLPPEIGKENKGHNVYYMLPLLLGVAGLVWQCRQGRRGRRDAFIAFVLFFMTGIAIVLYLNQTPGEPRERDYAFAGSFYAFAVWMGLGVAALAQILSSVVRRIKYQDSISAWGAVIIGLCVPLQMLSQTADDHDRSGRTAARDYAINYLESLEPNAIIFLNGDNFTFPLWYVQEVEGIRRDVRIINLAYLTTDWYAIQLMQPSYAADPVPSIASPRDLALRRRATAYFFDCDPTPTDALVSLREIYADEATANRHRLPQVKHPVITIPISRKAVLEAGLVELSDTASLPKCITIDMRKILSGRTSYIRMDELLMLDIIASNAATGWKRPIYWTNISQGKELLGFAPYLRQEGMAYRLTPSYRLGDIEIDSRRSLEAVDKFHWGGANSSSEVYFDDTNGKMLSYQRRMLLQLVDKLLEERKPKKALEILQMAERNLPNSAFRFMTYNSNYMPRNEGVEFGSLYVRAADMLGDEKVRQHGVKILLRTVENAAKYYRYYHSLGSKAVYTTVNTGLTARNFFMTVDAYRSATGEIETLKSLPVLQGIDLETAEKNWTRYFLRQSLLHDARPVTELRLMPEAEKVLQPMSVRCADSTMEQRILQFIESGGTLEQLRSYAEFSSFPFSESELLPE